MPLLDFEKIKAEGLDVDFVKLSREGYEALKPEDHYRLKTYGVCAQRHEGFFMIRIRIPGGIIRADPLKKIAGLAERYGHGWGHLTTRGNIELHSVQINDFSALRDELASVGITTRSSCGHTFRNILGCHKNGVCFKELFDLYPWIRKVHDHVFERADFYNRKLPRRLNVSFSGCGNCAHDAHINDIGFIAKKVFSGEKTLYGFELWVGGSLGAFPRLGLKLRDFTSFDGVLPALEAITELYCLYGERKNPSKARLKFVVESMGIEKFREEFEKLLVDFKGKASPLDEGLTEPRVFEFFGSHPEGEIEEGVFLQPEEGLVRVEFWVPLGEMKADQMKEVADLSFAFADGFIHHTPRQNFEFHNVKRESLGNLLREMGRVGFRPKHSQSILNVVACPGTSFCSLAVTSSQGASRILMSEFEKFGIFEDPFLKGIRIHISGCPNSCAKHQIADIGLSGGMTEYGGLKRYGYQLMVGGRFNGMTRLGFLIRKGIPDDGVLPAVAALLDLFKEKREGTQTFADFVDRIGPETLGALLEERLKARGGVPVEVPVRMIAAEGDATDRGKDFLDIGSDAEWATPRSAVFSFKGDEVAVFKTPEGFRACQNTCPHAGGSLGEGRVSQDRVTCPLHGWQFDLKSGECLSEPGPRIRIYSVEVKEGRVSLKP